MNIETPKKMSQKKVHIGSAFCMCHGHYVSRNEAGEMVSELGIHDGGRTYIKRNPVEPGSLLYEKAEALFALHSGALSVDEQVAILRKYGRKLRTFTIGTIQSNYIGDTTVNGETVGIDDVIFVNGGLVAKTAV